MCARIDPNKDPYDVALDTFEKGMTSARLDQVFEQVCWISVYAYTPIKNTPLHIKTQVKTHLIPLLASLRAAPHKPDDAWLYKHEGEGYDTERQAALCKALAGRNCVFCGGGVLGLLHHQVYASMHHHARGTATALTYTICIRTVVTHTTNTVDMGFNLDNGRLDVSVHPFTGGAHPTDVRYVVEYGLT